MRLSIIAAGAGLGLAALLVGGLLSPGTAEAQRAPESARFVMQPVEGGLMRLDTRTGAMSFCTRKADAWVCEAVPDDRAALEAEIGRLQARLATLEKGRAGSGTGVPDIMAPPEAAPPASEGVPAPGASPEAQAPAAPSEADEELSPAMRKRLDQALDVTEHVFRRFFGMVERFRQDAPDGEPSPPPPAQPQSL